MAATTHIANATVTYVLFGDLSGVWLLREARGNPWLPSGMTWGPGRTHGEVRFHGWLLTLHCQLWGAGPFSSKQPTLGVSPFLCSSTSVAVQKLVESSLRISGDERDICGYY